MNNFSTEIRVLVADRHQLFREGLRLMLEADPGIRVIGEASDGMEAAELARTLKPDVMLLDHRFPPCSARETLELVGQLSFETRTLILATKAEECEILELLQGGASGFVLKESSSQLLRKSIHSVMAGQYWITRHGITKLVQELIREPHNRAARSTTPNWGLTLRENQIVSEIVAGSTNKQIAESLNLSEQTVKHHLTSIFDKVGASSRLELALMVRHFAVSQSGIPPGGRSNLSDRNFPILKTNRIDPSVAPGGRSSSDRSTAEDLCEESNMAADPRAIRSASSKKSATG
jgi:two-component system, NarL family, nitrate/nitrite response regulator NarL